MHSEYHSWCQQYYNSEVLSEIGDIRFLPNADKLSNFAGIAPINFTSAGKNTVNVKIGWIIMTGSPELQHFL